MAKFKFANGTNSDLKFTGMCRTINGQAHTLDTYKYWLERVTYKPGWTLRLDEHGLTIGLGPTTEATGRFFVDPDNQLTFAHHRPLPPLGLDEVEFYQWLLSQIIMVEKHEVAEFLQVDKQQIFQPHYTREQPMGNGDSVIGLMTLPAINYLPQFHTVFVSKDGEVTDANEVREWSASTS